MKKLLSVSLMTLLLCGSSFAATNFGQSLKNAVKQDIQATKSDVKQAVKKDIDAKTRANAQAAANKKAEKIKELDSKINSLNKELASVKNDKNITETQRVLKVRNLERQIKFYQEQKTALQ